MNNKAKPNPECSMCHGEGIVSRSLSRDEANRIIPFPHFDSTLLTRCDCLDDEDPSSS